MKKFLLLLTVAAFSLNCGSSTSGTNNAANKPANAATPANANKPAATPANSATPASNSSAPSEKSDASNPELDFTIVNKTGYDIKALYVGPSGTGDWTKDDEVMKGRTFANGSSLDIKFNPRAKAELWDIKVDWADDSESVEWLKLNLTKIEKVTLTYDKETNKTTANVE